jgi:hypothetical protein
MPGKTQVSSHAGDEKSNLETSTITSWKIVSDPEYLLCVSHYT